MEIPFILNPNSLEESLMNMDSYVPVIHRSPVIYFAFLRIFCLSSRLTFLSNTDEAEDPPLDDQYFQRISPNSYILSEIL